jgi:hypothetical protein
VPSEAGLLCFVLQESERDTSVNFVFFVIVPHIHQLAKKEAEINISTKE